MAVFEKTTLGNGIRVVSASMPQVNSVSCFVMLAAGSRYETAESKGIAHFSEHMFFKGTERRPTARTIATEIDAIGGEFNAFTGKELTGYYVKCGSETRDVAFDVLSDMLLHSRFDPAEIEKEKGVILEEMNVYLDNPQRYIGSVYDRLLYADQPLGWDILGSKETIEAATRETFISYLDAWYKPERIVVGVGGRIGEGLMEPSRGAARRSSRRRRPRPRRRPSCRPTALRCSSTRSSRSRPISSSACAATRSGIRTATRSSSSRSFSAVECPRGSSPRCARSVGSRTTSTPAAARTRTPARSTRVRGSTSTASTRRSRRSSASCEGIAAEPVPAEELEKARGYSKGRFVLRLESPQGTIQYGLRREVLEGEIEEPEELLRQIDAVTAEDVQRVARDLLEREAAVPGGRRAVRRSRALREADRGVARHRLAR